MAKKTYARDEKYFNKLIGELYQNYREIALPPEYAYFIQENSLQMLIRLARYKFVARQLKRTDRVLEVGCGSGLGAIFLGQHCHSVDGIDVNEQEIKEAEAVNRRENVRFSVADYFTFKASHKYDVIVLLDVIEHMDEALGEKLIDKTADDLKENGWLVVGTPSCYSYEYQSQFSKAAHVKLYDQAELVGLIEKHYGRCLAFSMNDEMVHTGFSKLAWYYFVLAFGPRLGSKSE